MNDEPEERRRWASGPEPPERPPSAHWVELMVERLASQFSPLEIRLFGSHARDERGDASDIDLLVVLPDAEDTKAAAVEMRRALSDLPVAKDIVVTTPEEIERRGDLVGGVLRPALREGQVVYARG